MEVSLLRNELSFDLHRYCLVQPLWVADYSDRLISTGIVTDYRGYPKIKIGFDVTCLAVTAGLTLLFLHRLDGLGIGTILAAFTMGKGVGIIGNWMDRRFQFVSVLANKLTWFKPL